MDSSNSHTSKIVSGSLLDQWKKKKSKQNPDSKERRITSTRISTGMQNIWTSQQINPSNPFYQHTEAFKFLDKSQIDINKLCESIVSTIHGHEIFNYSFSQNDNDVNYEITDLTKDFEVRDLGNVINNQDANTVCKAFGREIFSLENDLLIRAGFLEVGESELWLLISMHHIIGDFESLNILFQGIINNYLGFDDYKSQNKNSFAQYLASENSTNKLDDQKYWTDHFSEFPPILNLDISNKRKKTPTYEGKCIYKLLDKTQSAKVFDLANKFQSTTYVIILSIFKQLLKTYSGESHISVGVPYSNRIESGYENVIGYFNKILIIDSHLSKCESISDLFQLVKSNVLSAFSHSKYEYSDLLRHLNPPRVAGINPLYQVMYIHNVKPGLRQQIPFNLDQQTIDLGVSKFDMTLFSYESDNQISLKLEYDTALFDHWYIERIFDHFSNVLDQIYDNGNLKIEDLQVVSSIELSLIESWNDTNIKLPRFENINQAFSNIVREKSEAKASSDISSSITYYQLDEKAKLLASRILALVKPGTVIGVQEKRSVNFIIAILGVLKAGCTYLPLDPEYPEERLNYMIADSQAGLIISEIKHSFSTIQTISVNSSHSEKLVDIDLPYVKNTDNAYVIYTSGSTGNPKGVLVSHANLLASTFARTEFYPENPQNFLLLSPFSFDSSIAGIFWSLLTGGNLVISSEKLEQNPEKLGELIRKQNITHTLLLPSLYDVLLETVSNSNLTSLNTVIVAGESCSYLLVEKHYRQTKNCILYNEYGPTEATVWSIAAQLDTNIKSEVIIGTPIANTKAYILNENGHQVPIGVKGQLFIGGQNLTKGYINNPQLTNEKFTTFQKQRVYKTGDIVRIDSKGNIHFFGRHDNQVKVRGHRIELEEINTEVVHSGLIDNSCVRLYVDTGNKPLLVVYLIPNAFYKEEELVKHLEKKLPYYMVPHIFVVLKDFPKLPNGKIDFNQLPPPQSSHNKDKAISHPKNEGQKLLVDIWKDVLNRPKIGIDDNFFSLGGDSIVSILMASKALKKGLAIKPNYIFKYQTIRELEYVLRNGDREDELIEQIEIVDKIEISNLQTAFLINQQSGLKDEGLITLEFNINGKIDLDRFKIALEKTIARHDVLRTVLVKEDGYYMQEVKTELPYILYTEKTSIHTLNINLQHTPNLFALLKIDKESYKFVWQCHHIFIDGWSSGVIFQDLLKFYDEHVDFPSIYNFPSYLNWKNKLSSSIHIKFWQSYFCNTQAFTLLNEKKTKQRSKFTDVESILSLEQQDVLDNFCQKQKIAKSTLFQLVWSIILGGMFKSTTVNYGLTVSGRNLPFPTIQNMSGLFMNTVPEVVSIPSNKSIKEWLTDHQIALAEKRSHDHCSVQEIKKWINLDTGRSLFDALFIYGNFLMENTEIGGLKVTSFQGGFSSSYPLSIRIKPMLQTEILWRYDQNKFTKQDLNFLVKEFNDLLYLITSEKISKFSDLIGRWKNYPVHFKKTTIISNKNRGDIHQVNSLLEIENLIISDWKNVLQCEVNKDSDFFELGGSSLDAVESISGLSTILKTPFPASIILTHRTPKKLAEYLIGIDPSKDTSEIIVPMKSGNGKNPIFCFHAGGSQIFFYRPFARFIDPDVPVYSIQTPNLLERESPKSIKDLAKIYLREMRKIKPEGPYWMVGTCFSNTLLVEISDLLAKTNELGNQLFVVDSAPSLHAIQSGNRKKTIWSKAFRYIMSSNFKKFFTGKLNKKTELNLISEMFDTDEEQLINTISILNKMYREFRWKTINDDVHLIRSSEFAGEARKKFHLTVWSKISKSRLYVHQIHARHVTIFEGSSAEELATVVNSILKPLNKENDDF